MCPKKCKEEITIYFNSILKGFGDIMRRYIEMFIFGMKGSKGVFK